MQYSGEAAALACAACWSLTALLFSFAVQRLGSFSLNLVRITLATFALAGLTFLFSGFSWLGAAPSASLGLLALSGWIGLTLGDWAYLRSLHLLGPRLASLLTALAPPIAALLGFVFLRERPGWIGGLGMALTLAGIAWVVLEREASGARGHRVRGACLGALAALGQAVGLILSKIGMSGGIDPLPATAVRMTAAGLGIWLLALVSRRPLRFARLRTDRRLALATAGASLTGPVVGIWLSLVAVHHAQAGIVATLMATMPVLVLPLVILVEKERVSLRAGGGALLAVLGIALLFTRR